MRHFFALAAAFLFCCFLTFPASASDVQDPAQDDYSPVVLTADSSADPLSVPGDVVSVDDRSTYIEALEVILGPYNPRTMTVTSYLPDGTVVTSETPISGLAGLDVSWIAGCFLLSVLLIGIIKLVGVVIRN
ncbi:MAG: hypothetical protein PUB51_02530 [Oscillospiraceae bacterium]|nr:hypothetical protein [Oscillospiraceae bacterium]